MGRTVTTRARFPANLLQEEPEDRLFGMCVFDAIDEAKNGSAEAISFLWFIAPTIARHIGVDMNSTAPKQPISREFCIDGKVSRRIDNLAKRTKVAPDLVVNYLLENALVQVQDGVLPVPVIEAGAKEFGTFSVHKGRA